jgi:hypothetical protein
MVVETNQAYAYAGDDPINSVDPLGLCNTPGVIGFYPGDCATNGPEAIAAGKYIESHAGSGGWSLTQALHSEANYWAGVGNGVVSTATFGQVHVSAPYCGALSWAYGVGTGFGTAASIVGSTAAATAFVGTTTVGDFAYGIDSLGPTSSLFGNDTLGATEEGLLNQRGSAWQIGWSVDSTISPTAPGFRISTPFIDHIWITHASGF